MNPEVEPRPRRRLGIVAALALFAAACGSGGDGAAPSPTSAPESTPAEATTVAPTEAPNETDAPGVSSSAPATTLPPNPLYDEAGRAGIPDQPSNYQVALYGDSVAHSVQEHVDIALDTGLRIDLYPRTFPGSSVCDWFDAVEQDLVGREFWAVILLFSNNTFTDCMADEAGDPLVGEASFAKYESDLRRLVDRFRETGAFVYLPTFANNRGAAERGEQAMVPFNSLFAQLASEDDGVFVVDAAAAVLDADGNYTETLPCLDHEPCVGGVDADGIGFNYVREGDGTHFCSGGFGDGVPIEPGACPAWSSGAFRYAGAMTAPIIEAAYAQWAAESG